ncbi:MAG: SDR family oxidoreductase [Pseudomonadota bacterium]
MNLFVFGAGYSGRAIAAELADKITWGGGTTRSDINAPLLSAVGLETFIFDGKEISQPVRHALKDVTHLIKSIAPHEGGDPLLNLVDGDLKALMPNLQWSAYLSTVGVYGDHQGAWVDEETVCKPVSKRSIWRRRAEEQWQAAAEQSGVPCAILRLSGIYGPGRNRFINIEKGTARRLVKPGQVFNRIHVDDIAGATAHLLERGEGGLWNVTDNLPAPPQDVITYSCELMGVEPPPEIDFETADLTPMARSFYGENKRVSNKKLRDSGYILKAPDYKSALAAMWQEDNWRG